MRSERGRRRALGTRLALVLAGVAAGALLCEGALRVAGISHPVFHGPDPHRGWACLPGAEGRWRSEGEARVRINADGLRDRDHSRIKPENTFRIAVLGDSFAAAFQVAREDAFWSVMERELSGCAGLAGRRPEVINFGVNNYGTAHELLTLEHHVAGYDPDLVVLAMFTGNDVLNNSRRLNPGSAEPFFVLRGDALELDTSFRDTPAWRLKTSWAGKVYYALLRRSRLVQLIAHARAEAGRARMRRAWERLGGGAETGLAYEVYREPDDPAWSEAWEITERLLVRIREAAAAQGAGLLVVTLSNPEQVHPDRSRRAELERRLGVDDLFYPDRRIAAVGEREGFDVLNLARPMREHAERTGELLHGFDGRGFGHWNAGGHRLAGQLIARRICRAMGEADAPRGGSGEGPAAQERSGTRNLTSTGAASPPPDSSSVMTSSRPPSGRGK